MHPWQLRACIKVWGFVEDGWRLSFEGDSIEVIDEKEGMSVFSQKIPE